MKSIASPTKQQNIILVDSNNSCIGYADKLSCHQNEGSLHRAFSVLIFNTDSELLLQQRSAEKMLWPNYWSNSCCSHPHPNETTDNAASRRLREELKLNTVLHEIYSFQYHAQYKDVGCEREFCSVFVGVSNDKPQPNPREVSAYQYINAEKIDQAIKSEVNTYTPWFILEWNTLRKNHWNEIQQLIAENS